MDLISVIIPVYKVEKYLDKCVQSIVDQTYRNLEIILVDDGSPDNCPAMCDAWAEKDSRIRVIHQNNGGGGKARNAALDCATGEYVGFVDSDDYIAPDFFEYMEMLFEDDIDIVECDFTSVTDDVFVFHTVNTCAMVKRYTAEEALREHIHDRIFRQIIWNKLYRREAIGAVRFPEGTKIDDEFFTYRVLGNARHLQRSERVLYAYRQQGESVMHELSPERRLEALRAKEERCLYMAQAYPALENECLTSLWMTAMYQRQLSLLNLKSSQSQVVQDRVRAMLRKFPIRINRIDGVSTLSRLWLIVAWLSFDMTCKLRNLLKIGL